MTARYILIKQKNYKQNVQQLSMFKMMPTQNICNKKVFLSVTKTPIILWKQMTNINKKMAELFDEIKLFNSFWAKYLTFFYIFVVIEICYIAFILFFYPVDVGFQKHLFSVVGTQLLFFLNYVTWQCSHIVNRNVQLARKIQKIGIELIQQNKNNINTPFLKLNDQLKFEQMVADFKNVESISSFCLIIGFEINSKMFQSLYTYISLFFMMILNNYHRNRK